MTGVEPDWLSERPEFDRVIERMRENQRLPEVRDFPAWREERRTWSWDQAVYDRLLAQWRGLGAPTMYINRITIQKLIVVEMGAENTMYAVADYPAACERYFEAANLSDRRLIEVINASPLRLINFGDNLHCETLSPRLFEEFVLPAYLERTSALHAGGKWVCSHWDGKVKSLLKYAKVCGLDGIEAITPLPQGDVTLEETKEALGDEVFLIDGIPAIYFDNEFGEDELIACAEKVIDLFAPKLILGVSDEMSSRGEIERIVRPRHHRHVD
jgi:hypothetical protein